MLKIKDIPKVDRPRERLLQKGANALSKTDLLAILLGSGIKGTNVQTLAKTIITKVDKKIILDFLFTGFPCQPFSEGGYRKGLGAR
ncbi:DNA repair protein RadC [uncultured Candidatus Thioglobus sp.]|nr:DNA repair protein RadC [uncultured Candidatus Thioglobus sp.]